MHAGRQGATRAASANIYPPPRFFLFYAICRCRSRWRSSVPEEARRTGGSERRSIPVYECLGHRIRRLP
eukprot:6195030-Pleurochrysis_carterae.AAC.2